MENISSIKEVAAQAALEAGRYALGRVGSPGKIEQKTGRNDLVTDVDKKCESIVIGRIRETFPDHSVLAEESGEDAREKEHMWIIDPLDGTTNYAHSFPMYCVSVACMIEDEAKVGAVYVPALDELFTASKGEGAFLNGERITVSKVPKVSDALVATGFAYNVEGKVANLPHLTAILKASQAVRRAGSAAIDLCYTACGRFDGFWEMGLKPWDTAAGHLIVTEAGGTVTTFDNKPFDVFGDTVVATNGTIHEEFISLLKNDPSPS